MNLAVIATAGLVFCRIVGLMSSLPVFSAQGTPKAVPVFAAIGTVLMVAPSVPLIVVPNSAGALLIGVVSELGLGMLAGMSVRVVFAALAMGTELMAMQMGLAMATMFNPLERQQSGPMGTLASWTAGLAFLGTGQHLRCLELVGTSFESVPPGAGGIDADGLRALVAAVEASFELGVQLSGPILVMVWFVNVLVAVLARLAPRMNVFFSVGMTITSSVGIVLLAVSLPWIMAVHGAAVKAAILGLGASFPAP